MQNYKENPVCHFEWDINGWWTVDSSWNCDWFASKQNKKMHFTLTKKSIV